MKLINKTVETAIFYLIFVVLLTVFFNIALAEPKPKKCFKQTIPDFKMTHRARCE